ncbi:MAG: glycosyltransferase family 39 protein, partial [Porticoccaceae bacterium]
ADDEWHALNTLLKHDAGYIFRHFGHADHSIPLTLYYALLANTLGLSEFAMRLPLVLAGIALLLAIPWLSKDLLDRGEQWVCTAFLALSPLAIYYSRTARPYALSMLLTFTALWLLLRWWREPRAGRAFGFVVCAALAGWLHPVSLAFTGAAMLFVGTARLLDAIRGREWRPLVQMILLGTALLAPLAALLAPPVVSDWQAFAGKTGSHVIQLATVGQSVQLFAGTSSKWVAGAWLLVGLYGAGRLFRRDRQLTAFWVWTIATPPFVIAMTQADWIHHALVFTRYNLLVLPVFAMFAAVGLLALFRGLGAARLPAAGGTLLALFATGPVPQLLPAPNQFTGHMSYQFDYDAERNVYNQSLQPAQIPAFYRDLGHRPGQYVLVEAPWSMEWHFNPLHFYQQAHRQKVLIGFLDGLCASDRYGEYPATATRQLAMRHFIHLDDLERNTSAADFLVFHRQLPGGSPPGIDICLAKLNQRLGAPVFEDETITVFSLGADAADAS